MVLANPCIKLTRQAGGESLATPTSPFACFTHTSFPTFFYIDMCMWVCERKEGVSYCCTVKILQWYYLGEGRQSRGFRTWGGRSTSPPLPEDLDEIHRLHLAERVMVAHVRGTITILTSSPLGPSVMDIGGLNCGHERVRVLFWARQHSPNSTTSPHVQIKVDKCLGEILLL